MKAEEYFNNSSYSTLDLFIEKNNMIRINTEALFSLMEDYAKANVADTIVVDTPKGKLTASYTEWKKEQDFDKILPVRYVAGVDPYKEDTSGYITTIQDLNEITEALSCFKNKTPMAYINEGNGYIPIEQSETFHKLFKSEVETKWHDQEVKPKGWDCPSCGKNLPSGIIGISNHWAECGGKKFQTELQAKIKDKDFGIEQLKQLQEKHYGKQE